MTNGEGAIGHRLILGPGGSGKTTLLRRWIAEAEGPVASIIGRPARFATAQDLALAVAADTQIVALDDAHWATEECLEELLALSGSLVVWVARRSYPNPPSMMAIADVCTEALPATRMSMLGADEVGARLAVAMGRPASGEIVDSVFSLTLGSPGLLADVVAHGDLGLIGEEGHGHAPDLVDQVAARVRRCGPGAWALAGLLAFDPDVGIERAVGAIGADLDASDAERSLRVSGLVDERGQLAPIVADCLEADMTVSDRLAIQSRLAASLGILDPIASARYVDDHDDDAPDVLLSAARARCGDDPDEAGLFLTRIDVDRCTVDQLVELAQLALRLGHESLDRAVQRGSSDFPAAFESVTVARQMRLLRWPLAAQASAVGSDQGELRVLAGSLVGRPSGLTGATPEGVEGMTLAIDRALEGDVSGAFSQLTGLADDFRATDSPSVALGLTPHLLGALVGLLAGYVEGAGLLLDEAIEAEAGGRGETTAARSLRAFTALRQADYPTTLEAMGDQVPVNDHRLRLFSAGLVAGLARRSGDTARMRDAWAEADAVLSRPTASWLLTEILSELLLVGVKLGHERRVGEVLGELESQLAGVPPAGPGPVSLAWLRFQLAVQRADPVEAAAESEVLSGLSPSDPRSLARVRASELWVQSMAATADEKELLAAAQELGRYGDRWEASRLLGSAALDLDDSDASRRLLEAARSLSADLADVEDGDALASLGLSEREAEVARLVVEGKIYKEIGAQLYISPKTVEHHVARAKQKLGAATRAEFRSIVAEAT